LELVTHACNPSYLGGCDLDDSNWTISRAQVVKYLHKALNSKLSPSKKKDKKKEEKPQENKKKKNPLYIDKMYNFVTD
jgi:hypothetical protein